MRPTLSFALSLAILQGCLHVGGKGAVKISGSVVAADGRSREGCALKLLRAADNSLVKARSVSSNFNEVLFIPPLRDKYYLTLACVGTKETFRSSVYDLVGMERHDNPIALGTIVLDR